MRQVDHTDISIPQGLSVGPPTGDEYPEDVREALKYLYLDKCYLCEGESANKGQVDQFHPADERHPNRAVDWQNLHWACPFCRDRKRKAPYQLRDENDPDTPLTRLIDPSQPPFGRRLQELIKFDSVMYAEGVGQYRLDEVVRLTVKFLNDKAPLRDRQQRYMDLFDVVHTRRWADLWSRLSRCSLENPAEWPAEEYEEAREALEWADCLYRGYLEEKQPYSHSIRQVLEEKIGLSAAQFMDLSTAYQKYWKTFQQAGDQSRRERQLCRLQKKLDFLSEEEAIASDAATKFNLKQQIERVEGSIRALRDPVSAADDR